MDQQRMLALFLSEGRELLSRVDAELLVLERTPDARESIDAAFRAVHSLKGMSATVGLNEMVAALHVSESLLSNARDAFEIPLAHLEVLLDLCDILRPSLDAAERAEAPPAALASITLRLEALVPEQQLRGSPVRDRVASAREVLRATSAVGAQWRVDVQIGPDALLPSARATVVVKRLAAVTTVLRVVPDSDAQADQTWDGAFTVWLGSGSDAEIIERAVRGAGDIAECHVAREVASAVESSAEPSIARTVRIPVQRLDDLLDLVGELVLARDRLLRTVAIAADAPAREAVEDASRLITQLRDAILTSRMVPLAQVFDRFPRHVRDTARELGKEIDLVLEGRELEVDRSLLDELSDPLLHLLRNSLDHGLESPADRVAAGKEACGRLVVRATRDGSMVAVTVADDGRGVNRQKVAASALAQGVADAETLAQDDGGLLQLLARPGLTTANSVTALSGRGVGVDVVRTRVQALGGRLDLATADGAGTAITIRLPLSVAILRALLVCVSGEVYCVPLSQVRATQIAGELRGLNAAPLPEALLVDGELLPLVSLRARLGLAPQDDVSGHLVVLECATGRVALLVDSCTSQQEIVVKPLQRVRGAATTFSGGTILADGTPSLILDINTLA
jgi:two-component system, chemotaxis family, sensor kinase CheA